jgi:hypothetical protein
MATLLHEYWGNEDGGYFSVVSEAFDEKRPLILPNALLIVSILADSWHEAMQRRNDQLDYGSFDSAGVEDNIYSNEEAADQQAYLTRRFGAMT